MATQKTVIEVDVQGTERVESMRSQMRKLREELARLPEGSAEFNKVQKQLGQLKDKVDDLGRGVNTLAGDPLERLNNSFGMIGSSILSLDFGAAVQGLNGVSLAVKDIKMKDITEGIGSLGTAFANLGKALYSNPIFLIAGVLAAVGGALYAYGQTMPYVTDQTKQLAEATHKATEASEKSLKVYDLEERKLRALGTAEEDIIRLRKQRVKETLKTSVTELQAQQKQLEELQASYVNSQQRVAKSAVGGLGVLGFQMTMEKLGSALGLVASDKQVADQTKNIDDLQLKIKEYEVQILELDKKEKDIHEKKIDQQNKEQKATEKNLIDRQALVEKYLKEEGDTYEIEGQKKSETEIEAEKDRLEKVRIAAVEIGETKVQYETDYARKLAQIQLEEADKTSKALIEGEKAFQDAKYKIAADTIGGLMDLNSALVDSGLIDAKKGFQIAKTLGIAQTIMSTIEGAQNAFTTANKSLITSVFPAYPYIQAGIATAAGLARVASLKAQQFNGGGGSQPSTSMGGGGGSYSTPSAPAVDLSFLNKGSNKAQPLQTYVLATNVSNAQEAEQKIKDQSRLIK